MRWTAHQVISTSGRALASGSPPDRSVRLWRCFSIMPRLRFVSVSTAWCFSHFGEDNASGMHDASGDFLRPCFRRCLFEPSLLSADLRPESIPVITGPFPYRASAPTESLRLRALSARILPFCALLGICATLQKLHAGVHTALPYADVARVACRPRHRIKIPSLSMCRPTNRFELGM